MAVSMKDLRYKTREVMQRLKRGEKPIITYRNHPIAKIIPLTSSEKKSFRDIGYGMWQNNAEIKDVNQWLDQQRKPRFNP